MLAPSVVSFIYSPAATAWLSPGLQELTVPAIEVFGIVILFEISDPPSTLAVITALAVAMVPSITEWIADIVPALGATTKQEEAVETSA